jgi:O-antigen/teichoic acid export membrane protein
VKFERAKAVRGFKWTTASSLFVLATSPLLLLVQARFLSPEEFAIIAIISFVIGLIKVFEGAGVNQGVIVKEHVDTAEASSLFIFNLFLTMLPAAILFVLAEPIAGSLGFANLDDYLKLLCLVVLFHGPSNFYRAFLEKFFLFKEIATVTIIRHALLLISTTVFLFMGFGVLGVVYGQLISVITATLLLVFWGLKHNVTKLKFIFSINKLRFFLKFGAFTSGEGIITYVSRRVDELIIVYILGPEIMGIYYFGKNLLEQLIQLSQKAFEKVLLPSFAILKNDRDKLFRAYNKLTYFLALVFFPVLIGISLTAHLFVPVIFGAQWEGSIIVIQVISVAIILKLLTDALAVNLLYSFNKPDTVFYMEVSTSAVYILFLFLLAPLGILAVIITYSAFLVIKSLALQYVTQRYLKSTLSNYFSNMKGAVFFSLAMAAAVLGFQYVLSVWTSELLLLLIASIAAGALVYTTLTLIWDKDSLREFYKLMKSRET